MVDQPNPRDIKSKVSATILREPGVAGVGIPGGNLTVYLEKDSPILQEKLSKIIQSLIGDATPVSFLVTGGFRAG